MRPVSRSRCRPICRISFYATRDGAKCVPAADLVAENRELITDKIEYWTGVGRPVVRALVESIARHCRELNLHAEVGKESRYLVELAAYGTTLAMNYLTRGKFEQA